MWEVSSPGALSVGRHEVVPRAEGSGSTATLAIEQTKPVGALIGLPMFFEIGLVLLMPVIFLVARRSGLSLIKVGIPALAGLSAMHGLVPPHPGPLVAIAALNANLGITLGLGVLVGNAVAYYFDISAAFPVGWAIAGVVAVTVIAVVFGGYPAIKAARLDPVESLRYE